jgi:myo-inositol-1(or 4)-monophosphatase
MERTLVNNTFPTLAQVLAWTKQAGQIVRAKFDDEHTIGYKGAVDVVTEADKASEDYLLAQIRQHFPGHAVITEESGELDGDSENCWIIDPLDGTINYAHHLPIYSVSVAYRHHGELVLGVVHDPSLEECFYAEKGKGAFLNDKKIVVSQTPELIKCLLVSGFPYERQSAAYQRALRLFNHMTTISQGVRRLGSAALDMCYVACGRLDAYYELSIHLWDIAAAALIIQEAGGVVRDIHGNEDFMTPPFALVGANPTVYPQLLAEIKSIP